MSTLPHYEHIEQGYAGLTREILNSYTPTPGNEIEAAAAIHHNLHTLIDYEQRHAKNGASREFRSIPEIIKKGGNCEEKACLQATLLKDYKDIEVKLAVIKNPDRHSKRLEEIRYITGRHITGNRSEYLDRETRV